MAATHPYSVDLSDSSDGSDEEATGSSTSSSHNHSVKSTSSIIDKAFIQREEQHVRRARYFLALTTLACAIAVSVAVYYSISQNDYQNFQKEVRAQVVLPLLCKSASHIPLLNYYSMKFMQKICS